MSTNCNRRTFFLVIALALACLAPQTGYAHPMGNFSVNHFSEITIRQGEIDILYIIDMAEIPTYQEIQQAGINAKDGDLTLVAYLPQKAVSFKDSLALELEGRRLLLTPVSQQVIFPSGAGGLPTMKMAFVYRAALPETLNGSVVRLRYADLNFPGHAGWKEIVVHAPTNTLVSSSVPRTDRSQRLSNYPTDLLSSPPQDIEANISFDPAALIASPRKEQSEAAQAGPVHKQARLATQKEKVSSAGQKRIHSSENRWEPADAASTGELPLSAAMQNNSTRSLQLQANKQTTPRSAFTELISKKEISLWFLVLSAIIAAGLGALHALEPGHGKTIVAAYLVGSRGTARHALLLGIIVTISHTAGVYLLGGITLYAQKYILPERIYPFLGVLSGILIAGMGAYLLLQRYLGAEFAHTHSYERPAADAKPNAKGPQDKRFSSQLLLLGITGGMIPCPGALVVLLSAVALHRTGLGLFLIVAFSIGLATVLICMGLAAVYAGRLLSRFRLEGRLVNRWLPMTSATIITILGFGITLRALMAAGMVHLRF